MQRQTDQAWSAIVHRPKTGNGRRRQKRRQRGKNWAGCISRGARMPDIAKRRRFLLFLVKPSHYDDQGYVIQWWKSALPSNSLACLFGIAQKCMEDQVLGEDVDIEIFPVDETNTRVRPDRIIRQIKDNGGFGMVGFVGVQSNQFPRVMDCARPMRAAGVPVCHRRLPCLRLPLHAAGAASIRSTKRSISAFRSTRARPKGGSTRCCATPPRGSSSRSTTISTIFPGWKGRRAPTCRPSAWDARSA